MIKKSIIRLYKHRKYHMNVAIVIFVILLPQLFEALVHASEYSSGNSYEVLSVGERGIKVRVMPEVGAAKTEDYPVVQASSPLPPEFIPITPLDRIGFPNPYQPNTPSLPRAYEKINVVFSVDKKQVAAQGLKRDISHSKDDLKEEIEFIENNFEAHTSLSKRVLRWKEQEIVNPIMHPHQPQTENGTKTKLGLYFDGKEIKQAYIQSQKYFVTHDQKTFTYDVEDFFYEPYPSAHQGYEVIHQEFFPLTNETSSVGLYLSNRPPHEDEKIIDDMQQFVYCDGKQFYIPHIDQRIWKRENSKACFVIISFNRDSIIQLNPQAKFQYNTHSGLSNCHFQRGLYKKIAEHQGENQWRLELWSNISDGLRKGGRHTVLLEIPPYDQTWSIAFDLKKFREMLRDYSVKGRIRDIWGKLLPEWYTFTKVLNKKYIEPGSEKAEQYIQALAHFYMNALSCEAPEALNSENYLSSHKTERISLHTACYKGYKELVLYLLEQGEDVNQLDLVGGFSPLYFACLQGGIGIIKILVEKGVQRSLAAGTLTGVTLLHIACFSLDQPLAEYLFSIGEKEMRHPQWGGLLEIASSPMDLHFIHIPFYNSELEAARKQRNQENFIKFLIAQGARLEKGEDKTIIWAAKNGKIEILKCLVEKERAITGDLFFSAIHSNRPEIVEFFLNKDASPNLVDRHQYTALHEACSIGSYKIAKLLIERGAQVNATNESGNIPLFCVRAYAIDSCEIITLLVEKGSKIEAKNSLNQNILHKLAMDAYHAGKNKDAFLRYKKNIELFLNKGISLNEKDSKGHVPSETLDLYLDQRRHKYHKMLPILYKLFGKKLEH